MPPYEGKYVRLYEHLCTSGEIVECLTFRQIEEICGFGLPGSAREYAAWWANQPKGQSLAWLAAGFRSTAVSVDEERLTFVRHDNASSSRGEEMDLRPLTIAEAKERLARTLGVEPAQIEITVRA